jgi:GNAT superfamily N-acetyltransferase
MEVFYQFGKKIVGRFPVWIFRARPFHVYVIPLPNSLNAEVHDAESRNTRQGSSDFEIRWITDRAEATLLQGLARQESIAAFDPIARPCAAAWLGGKVVACAWLATESFEDTDLQLRFALQPGEVWLFAAVVESSHRNLGIYKKLLQFICDELDHNGFKRILLGVAIGNEPSLRAHARQGAKQVGYIFAVRSMGFTLSFSHGAVRRLSLLPASWRRPVLFSVLAPAEVKGAIMPACADVPA